MSETSTNGRSAIETWNKLMVPDASGGGPTQPVIDLVRHCQARGIPTVFWNKEDSPNFEHFWRTAVLFDHNPEYLVEIGFDGEGQGGRADLRPALPLVICG